MRKNIMKKMAAIVATAVLSVCSIVAAPMEAEAATTTELYLETEADAEYSVGFWQTTSGIQIDAEVTADGWTYAFEKVEDGLYKINLLLSETFSSAGMSISVNGVETYKCDPNWSGIAGAEAWTAFTEVLGTTDKVYIGLDTTNVTITVKSSADSGATEDTEATEDTSATEATEATKDTEATEATKDTEKKTDATTKATKPMFETSAVDNSSSSGSIGSSMIIIGVSVAVIVIVAIIVAIVIIASKKKTVIDDDDFEY